MEKLIKAFESLRINLQNDDFQNTNNNNKKNCNYNNQYN